MSEPAKARPRRRRAEEQDQGAEVVLPSGENVALTGYDTADRYFATRYHQGKRTVYSIDLSLAAIVASLPEPESETVDTGQRPLNVPHAKGFGDYVRGNEDWVSGALLLRAPGDRFHFEAHEEIGGSQFGVLSIPRDARGDLHILDGQHRVKGLHVAYRELNKKIDDTRSSLAAAKRDENHGLVAHFEKQLRDLEAERRRFFNERISIQIHVTDDKRVYEQMFVDINDTQLGVGATLRVLFDRRKVVNRATDYVLEMPALKDVVDLARDRTTGKSPYWISAKHIADLTRDIEVGISGRVGRAMEREAERSHKDRELADTTKQFLTILFKAFPDVEKMLTKDISPQYLRTTSLLGSTAFLRVLAGFYHEVKDDASAEDIREFFGAIAQHTAVPITEDSIWMKTGAFEVGASAPMGRRQDLQRAVDYLKMWFANRPEFLKVNVNQITETETAPPEEERSPVFDIIQKDRERWQQGDGQEG